MRVKIQTGILAGFVPSLISHSPQSVVTSAKSAQLSLIKVSAASERGLMIQWNGLGCLGREDNEDGRLERHSSYIRHSSVCHLNVELRGVAVGVLG